MDRTQFCNILTQRKDELGLSWLDLTVNSHINKSSLQKIFYGNTNFFVETAIKVASAINAIIVVKNATEQIELNSDSTLNWWAKKSHQSCGLSVNKFKDEIGMTRIAVTANLKGDSKMRIDTLLKWAEVTGYEIEVWSK